MKWPTYFLLLISALFIFSGKAGAEEFIVTNENELQTVLKTAAENDAIKIKQGIYQGNFTVNKPLTIKGEEGVIIKGPNNGDVITINADDVKIENLQIEGSGSQNAGIHVNGNRSSIKNTKIYDVFHGIVLKNSYGHQVDDNIITSYTDDTVVHKGHGIYLVEAPHSHIRNNIIFDTNDGVYLSYSNLSEISGNTVTNVRYGIHTMDSEDVIIHQNHLSKNRNGLMLMQSKRLSIKENYLFDNTTIEGAGLFLFDTFDSKISKNIVKNNNKGMYLENGKRNEISFNEFDQNDKGMELAKGSEDNGIYLNNFLNNNQQVITAKENENLFNIEGFGNYWDDQQHLHLDRDEPTLNASIYSTRSFLLENFNRQATNNYAYKSGDVFYHLTTKEPYLQIFSGSPAVALWNTIEQFVPIPSKQFIVDENPIQTPVVIDTMIEQKEMKNNDKNAVGLEKSWFLLVFMSISFLTLWYTRRMKNDA